MKNKLRKKYSLLHKVIRVLCFTFIVVHSVSYNINAQVIPVAANPEDYQTVNPNPTPTLPPMVTPTPFNTPTPNPSPTPTSTPIIEPSPTPTPVCQYKVTAEFAICRTGLLSCRINYGSAFRYSIALNNSGIHKRTGDTTPLNSCLSSIRKKCQDLVKSKNPFYVQYNWTIDIENHTNACVQKVLLGRGYNPVRSRSYAGSTFWDWAIGGAYAGTLISNALTGTGSKIIYLDDQCNLVEAGGRICGGLNSIYFIHSLTPISLVWNEQDNGKISVTDSTITFVPFAFNPNSNEEGYYAWRGSASMPLLVYDPEHTNVVNDGSQLFGTYSFGKKWKNGFEPLATLDRDKDGVLTGKELDSLALWFDQNQNALSEEGELKRIHEVGVTKISVKQDDPNQEEGDIISINGYERILNGKVVTAPIVDWLTKHYHTKPDESIKQSQDHNRNLSGYWEWSIEESEKGKNEGMFRGSFMLNEGWGLVEGNTMLELPLENNPDRVNQAILTQTFQGKKKMRNGMLELSFELIDQNDGAKLENIAIVSADGKSMKGQSKAFDERNILLRTYNWTAVRN